MKKSNEIKPDWYYVIKFALQPTLKQHIATSINCENDFYFYCYCFISIFHSKELKLQRHVI